MWQAKAKVPSIEPRVRLCGRIESPMGVILAWRNENQAGGQAGKLKSPLSYTLAAP